MLNKLRKLAKQIIQIKNYKLIMKCKYYNGIVLKKMLQQRSSRLDKNSIKPRFEISWGILGRGNARGLLKISAF